MIVLRLTRMGRTHRPYYRIVAQNKRTWRDGKFFDILGTWDPYPDKFGNKKLRLHSHRIRYWMGVGAQPSEAVARLLGKAGILPPPPATKSVIVKQPEDQE
jgi:small subunit ribosomal protein S16